MSMGDTTNAIGVVSNGFANALAMEKPMVDSPDGTNLNRYQKDWNRTLIPDFFALHAPACTRNCWPIFIGRIGLRIMTDDLISRNTLKQRIIKDYRKEFFGSVLWNILDDMPTVDAATVVHGRWVKAHGMMPPEYHHRKQCSMCGGWALQDYFGRERMSHYCPNWGARKDGGAEK